MIAEADAAVFHVNDQAFDRKVGIAQNQADQGSKSALSVPCRSVIRQYTSAILIEGTKDVRTILYVECA
jgi:hypothetical protein